MKDLKRKILSLVLALAMAVTLAPTLAPVYAEEAADVPEVSEEPAAESELAQQEDIEIVEGETVEFGGLLGYAPIIPVNSFSCERFIRRGGRIPAPIHSFKN